MKEKDISYRLRLLNQLLKQARERECLEMSDGKATNLQGWIITFLYRNAHEHISQKDIEEEFHIGKSTLSAILQRMENNNLINRTSSKEDSRVKLVTLTREAEEIAELLEIGKSRSEARLKEGIGPEELSVFLRVFDQMIENMSSFLIIED